MTDWMSAVSVINTVWRHLVISGDKHNADFWNNFKSHFTHFKDNRENLSSHSGHHCEQAEEPFLNKWRNKVSRTRKHLKCFRATEQLFLLERFLFSMSMWKKYGAGFTNASGGLLKHVCVCVFVFSRGRYLVALGRSWHPEEFTCSQCKAVLDEGGFFEERGSVYCTNCHDNRYAPNCSKCKKKITGVRARVAPQTWKGKQSGFWSSVLSVFKTAMPAHQKIRK